MAEMDPTVGVVFDRLADDTSTGDDVKDLVVGALLDDLDAALGGSIDAPARPAAGKTGEAPPPAHAYLGEVRVRGFRGIGPEVTLPLQPGPGLTLVVGRNGSGKSSFAEAVELALTGRCSRWADRKSKVWQEGWANLHAAEPPLIEVDIAVDGSPGTRTVVGTWADGNELDGVRWTVTDPTEGAAAAESMSTLGWTEAMGLYRPFLSYNELGSLLEEGPSKLYDALAAILGLAEVGDAIARLAQRRLATDEEAKEAKQRAKLLAQDLAQVEDERVQRAAACLQGTKWDLAGVEALALAGGDGEGADSESALLARLGEVVPPDIDRALTVAAAIRAAITARAAVKGSDAARALRTAELLQAALRLHADHGDQDCPVCGEGRLDQGRVDLIADEAGVLLRESGAAKAAADALARAVDDARRLLAPVPSVLATAATAGVELAELAQARDAWLRWLDAPDDPDPAALADHLDAEVEGVARATEALVAAARIRHDELEDLWRPWAAQMATFLPAAKQAVGAAEVVKRLKAAEAWLQDASEAIRNERFMPVGDQVKATWEVLRQNSSVELADVLLDGARTRRNVKLRVNVDEVEGVALGVMSQGELHALALSLFVPRATLPASPFGFLLIDDPVQAMDPARVDGLATLLANLAASRQVVVFTHDDRLPDAARRLGLDATVIEVNRRPGSVVDVRVARHPAYTYLDDAWGVAKSPGIPEDVRRRVVPGLCRHAIEAACIDASRRQLLAAGTSHDELEATLAGQHKLYQHLALALFGDADRSGDVLSWVNSHWGKRSADAVVLTNKGAHGIVGEFSGGRATDLISDVRAVVDQLVEL